MVVIPLVSAAKFFKSSILMTLFSRVTESFYPRSRASAKYAANGKTR